MCPRIRRAGHGLQLNNDINLPRTGTQNNKMPGHGQLGLEIDMTFRGRESPGGRLCPDNFSPMSNLDRVSNLFLESELSYDDPARRRKESRVFQPEVRKLSLMGIHCWSCPEAIIVNQKN